MLLDPTEENITYSFFACGLRNKKKLLYEKPKKILPSLDNVLEIFTCVREEGRKEKGRDRKRRKGKRREDKRRDENKIK